MAFFVLGVNHKECPVEVREKLHFGAKAQARALEALGCFQDIAELMILSTCNRVELCGYSHGAFPRQSLLSLLERTHEVKGEAFAPYLYAYEDMEAERHLFCVAAGLDSMVVGENEILGQVRAAFKAANEAGAVHSLFHRLVEKALKTGKDVREKTKINEGAVSISSVAVELAEKIFGRLAGERVMVLGAGEMSLVTLKNLRNAGADIAYVVSRDAEKGTATAKEFSAQWVDFKSWEAYLTKVDILIASTSASHPVVRRDQVKRVMNARRHRPLFLIDIAVPRDIETAVNTIDDVYAYNIDDLKSVSAANLRLRRKEIRAAEVFVGRAVEEYRSWLERLKARPTMERFELFLNEILAGELERGLREAGADPSRREEIQRRIRSKLLHHPLTRIKEASVNGGVHRYLEALHSLFNLDK